MISTLARLYGRVLKNRIEIEFSEPEEQNGFRAGRSCKDSMFTLKNPTNKIKERHLIFVYLQKAYDTVPLGKLWSCMQASGISKAYVNAVKVFYNNITRTVKIGRTFPQKCPVTKGLQQGYSFSPAAL